MTLHYERYRLNSYFGAGCTIQGHPVATRPLNGSAITRPPFERLSNFLGNFPNEVKLVGLADFYSNSPWYGLDMESIPFYGWKPFNYPYDGSSDGARAGIAAMLTDLAINGLDGVRKRSLMGAPSNEHPVRHTNLIGTLTNKPGRVKSVGYSGSLNGYPTFPNFQTAPATLSIPSIILDNYSVVKSATVNYTGLTCYLRDAVVNLAARVAAGIHNTAPANAGVASMKFSETYEDFTWEPVPNNPYAVASVSFIYTVLLTNAPLFDSEKIQYRITVAWESAFPTPWVGTGVAPVAHHMNLNVNAQFRQTYTATVIDHIVTNLQPNTVTYQYGGVSSFSESFLRPLHATSGKENYVEKYANVESLLATSPNYATYSRGRRITDFNSRVLKDLVNFQPLRFIAFTDAITEAIEGVSINILENFKELQQTLALVDFNQYMDKVNKIRKSGGNPIEILDVLSSTYLMVKYGIAPILQDAEALYTDLLPSIQRIRDLTNHRIVCYGQKTFDLPPGTYGYNSVRVLATSKVVGSFNLSTFFLGAYLMDAVGFFPSFERIWDLVDYSFLVDMFFNVDDRLKIIDDGVRTAGFLLNYRVDTICITADYDDSTLDSYGLIASGTTKPGLKFVDRVISKYAPRLGTSVYDVTLPGNPDWFSIGALIFQALQ